MIDDTLDEVLKSNLMTGRPVTSTALRERGLTRRAVRKLVRKGKLNEIKVRNRATGVVMNGYYHPDYKGPAKAVEPKGRVIRPRDPEHVAKEIQRYERIKQLRMGAR